MSRRARGVLAVLAISLGGTCVGWVIGRSTEPPPASKAFDPGPITAAVERRTIEAKVIGRADIGATIRHEVRVGGLAGDEVVTRGVARAGSPIASGDVVAELSGRPVLLLDGDVPMYRDVRPGDEGRDIVAIQRALAALGWPSDDPVGRFGPSTRAAVESWYRARGYEPAGPPAEAEERSQAAEATLVTAADERDESVRALRDTADSGGDVAQARRALDRAEADLRQARQAAADAAEARSTWIPRRELVLLDGLPLRISEGLATGAAPDGPIARLGGGPLVAVALFPSAEVTGIEVGMPGTLDEDGSGRSWKVSVVSVEAATTADGEGEAPEGDRSVIRLGFGRSPAELEGRNLRLTIVTSSSKADALVVPVGAVTTNAAGVAQVRVLRGGNDDDTAAVAVELGAEADGFVEVRASDHGQLEAGARVVLGRARSRAGDGE
ncbi:MAG TPA: peptidoglycan-binding domain-containing protein [Acidimicrobiales bacterium]|nr:peptidoglycan-binding domain-containing protein [Acidimicrobiales bacterium]